MKYVAIFAARGTVHSYEITLVHLISVLLLGQTIEISLPLGLQCSVSVLHMMYYITKHARGNFEVSGHHWWWAKTLKFVSLIFQKSISDWFVSYLWDHLENFLADFVFLTKLLVGWCNAAEVRAGARWRVHFWMSDDIVGNLIMFTPCCAHLLFAEGLLALLWNSSQFHVLEVLPFLLTA